MHKIWEITDITARAEGQAIDRHNQLRVIPKIYRKIMRPDIKALEVFVPVKNCERARNLKKLAASAKHRRILARLKNPKLYKAFH